jgi:hypothetical protein
MLANLNNGSVNLNLPTGHPALGTLWSSQSSYLFSSGMHLLSCSASTQTAHLLPPLLPNWSEDNKALRQEGQVWRKEGRRVANVVPEEP